MTPLEQDSCRHGYAHRAMGASVQTHLTHDRKKYILSVHLASRCSACGCLKVWSADWVRRPFTAVSLARRRRRSPGERHLGPRTADVSAVVALMRRGEIWVARFHPNQGRRLASCVRW